MKKFNASSPIKAWQHTHHGNLRKNQDPLLQQNESPLVLDLVKTRLTGLDYHVKYI